MASILESSSWDRISFAHMELLQGSFLVTAQPNDLYMHLYVDFCRLFSHLSHQIRPPVAPIRMNM